MTAGKDCFFSIFICKMEDLEREFLFPVDEMKKLSDYMSDQMALGLMGEPSDLKMLPSFVISLATGIKLILLLNYRR